MPTLLRYVNPLKKRSLIEESSQNQFRPKVCWLKDLIGSAGHLLRPSITVTSHHIYQREQHPYPSVFLFSPLLSSSSDLLDLSSSNGAPRITTRRVFVSIHHHVESLPHSTSRTPQYITLRREPSIRYYLLQSPAFYFEFQLDGKSNIAFAEFNTASAWHGREE